MKKRTFTTLGEAEMELLQHVWTQGRATVADVHERVLQDRTVAYTTVMTVLKKLADKGYLMIEKEGHAYVYSPARPPEQVRRNVLSEIVHKVFQGSPLTLVQTLVEHEDLSEEERTEILRAIQRLGNQKP